MTYVRVILNIFVFDDFDKIIGKFGSRTIEITHGLKVLKLGVLTRWKCHPFFVELFIDVGEKTDRFKLFYPFGFEEYGDDVNNDSLELYLDYRLSVANKMLGADYQFSDTKSFSCHKFLDTIVTIKEV